MKKLCWIFAAFMTALTIVLCSCSTDPMERVSERRSGYFTADNGGLSATAVSGMREEPFSSDGKVSSLKPYTLITLVPSEFDIDAVYTYELEAGADKFGGTMIVHPFAASFSAEIDFELTTDFTIDVKCGNDSVLLKMKSQVTGGMDYARAIDAAKNEIKPKGEYEIRARLVKNPFDTEGLCWHVAFITPDGESGVLLDPESARVLAKK